MEERKQPFIFVSVNPYTSKNVIKNGSSGSCSVQHSPHHIVVDDHV